MWLRKILLKQLEKNEKSNYFLKKIRTGKIILEDEIFINTKKLEQQEIGKTPSRSEIINFLMNRTSAENYLEIGVRNLESNFNKIHCKNKYSVDPGFEAENNLADFKVTSDVFFELLEQNSLHKIDSLIKFDIIFIDGLHISHQVEKDIQNSLKYIKDNGFIVLHDCNPPSEFHQRENYYYRNSPAGILWNGTTWKAFLKNRYSENLYSICFDTDWGIGVFSKQPLLGFNNLKGKNINEFYEFAVLDQNRTDFLNLTSFDAWSSLLK